MGDLLGSLFGGGGGGGSQEQTTTVVTTQTQSVLQQIGSDALGMDPTTILMIAAAGIAVVLLVK